jgi:TnpA family transposase
MLRVVISIRLGKITASSILRRLGTYSRKNKLYFAFRELARRRTLFLLRHIDDNEIRKTIHAATNKSEEYNGFVNGVLWQPGTLLRTSNTSSARSSSGSWSLT